MMELDQEGAYLGLRRMLFGALARLARQGFTVPPTDAMDLIQGFFAEAWPAVKANFDPDRGTKLETYVYAAFVRFARPRIAELHRWRSLLVDAGELAQIPDRPARLASPESERDLLAISDAVRALSPLHRSVLTAYLTAERPSERAIAEKLSFSRHRLRQTLVEAFAQVAVALGERGRIPESDWRVARALWEEGRTVADAARSLGVTAQQVRNARERIGALLVEQLRSLSGDLAD